MADRFRSFLEDMAFEIKSVDADVAMEAARIRGKYPGFKTCDALQIASAVAADADTFYTNDHQLLQYDEEGITVVNFSEI